MIQKFRNRVRSESGFTLVELLVVMLILGLLAAIAIPSFFNQRDKARDADAKTSVRTAQTAMETYATDNDGTYVGATPAALIAIESTLNDADGSDDSGNGDALTVPSATANTYTVTVGSDNDNPAHTFGINRTAGGAVTLTCTPNTASGDDGCPAGGDWG